jgi:Ca-activated chloride channel homolog
MKKKMLWICLLVVVFLFQAVVPVRADGIIIPPPPPPCRVPCPPEPPFPRPIAQLAIRYHHVTVSIQDQLAVTRVDQVFFNPNDWPVEGTYVFPLPSDAAVSEFTLWIDGKPVTGEVLDAAAARAYYDEVVRSLRDPALLEYEGRGAVRASVFPIPPQGERRIELEYTQALTAENGLVRYIYPLSTEKFSVLPLEEVRIRVEVRDRQAIRAVYSPSHPVGIDRRNDNHLIAGYEAKNVLPDSDFALYYSLGESEAFHLFSYRNPADPVDADGFFMLLLAPKPGDNRDRVAKDVLLVLDRSGSMDGEKFVQAQAALRFILKKLNPEDRFYLQAFSTGVETYARGLRPASEVNEALAWVDRLNAVGSTDINRALLEAAAAAQGDRPTYLIFLTDGLPTEGVTNTQEILNNFARQAQPNLRLFAFGVGYDVDTFLLDTLTQEHHGLSTYVRPGEQLDEILSVF